MTERGNRTQARLDDMVEATRLTRLGRLDESTALIQRSLFGLGARPDYSGTPPQQGPQLALGDRPVDAHAAEGLAAAQAALSPERVRAAVDASGMRLGTYRDLVTVKA